MSAQTGRGLRASRQTSAWATPVRFGGECAGLTLGASAPIGAAALILQNAAYDDVAHW
jgi:hypothetical protein